MESKCSAGSGGRWSSPGGGTKCLNNYLDHLMLLRVALAASPQTSQPSRHDVEDVSAQRPASIREHSPVAAAAVLSQRTHRACVLSSAGAASSGCKELSTSAERCERVAEEAIYYEVESDDYIALRQRHRRPSRERTAEAPASGRDAAAEVAAEEALIARRIMRKLSALAAKGVLDASSDDVGQSCVRQAATTTTRKSFRGETVVHQISSAPAASDSSDRFGIDSQASAPGGGEEETSDLAQLAEPVYETIPGDEEFDSVHHSCTYRTISAPPQLPPRCRRPLPPPPPLPQTWPLKGSSLAGGGDARVAPGAQGPRCCGGKAMEKRASCPELSVGRIKMGVAAKKAWEERYVRRPSPGAASAGASSAGGSNTSGPVTMPQPPAGPVGVNYKALPVVYC